MIFNFKKVTTLLNEPSRQAFGWLFITVQNKFRKEVTVNRHHQENHAGGMFGLLVSSDAIHRH